MGEERMKAQARAEFDPESSDGQAISDLNIALIIITSVVMLVRLYVRGIVTKGLGWDDLLAFIAWGLVVAFSCVEIMLVSRGVGSHIQDVPEEKLAEIYSLFPVDKLLFMVAGGFVRLSILASLTRINRDKSFIIWTYGTALASVAVALTSFFFILFSCSPVPDVFNAGKPDRACVSKYSMGQMRWANSILGTIIDLVIFGLSLWATAMSSTMRTRSIRITVIFIVGLFAIISTIVRLIALLTTDLRTDMTYQLLHIAPWFPLEVHTGLWCGCLPAFQSLLDLVVGLIDPRSRDHHNMRKLSRSSEHDIQDDFWHRDLMTANPHVSIHGQPRDPRGKRKASDADSEAGIVMLDNERGIKLTTEFSVHVEDSGRAGERSEDKVTKTPAWNVM